MTYTVSYSVEFKKNLSGFPKSDQMKIALFADQFEHEGLADHSRYIGKIAPSWGAGQAPSNRRVGGAVLRPVRQATSVGSARNDDGAGHESRYSGAWGW